MTKTEKKKDWFFSLTEIDWGLKRSWEHWSLFLIYEYYIPLIDWYRQARNKTDMEILEWGELVHESCHLATSCVHPPLNSPTSCVHMVLFTVMVADPLPSHKNRLWRPVHTCRQGLHMTYVVLHHCGHINRRLWEAIIQTSRRLDFDARLFV